MHKISLNDVLASILFPKDFVWGVATSAYQIEGAAQQDGRAPSIWDTFAHTPGTILDHSSGDVACDHYARLEQDLDLLQQLGVPAYRFSVSWSRVQPAGQGAWNEAGLAFYERLIDGLQQRGIAAHLTLYHWDLPQALQDQGGWGVRSTAQHFAAYASVIAERFGARLASIATLNEPWVVATLGHEAGIFAPGLKERKLAMQVSHHLLLAHGLALQAMRAVANRHGGGPILGIVLNQAPVHAATDSAADRARAQLEDGLLVRWYMDPLLRASYPQDVLAHLGADAPQVEAGDMALISAPLDFLGVNYYTRSMASADATPTSAGNALPPADSAAAPVSEINASPKESAASAGEKSPPAGMVHAGGSSSAASGVAAPSTSLGATAMGWEVYPAGLTELLRRLARDYRLPPLYITENGAAYEDQVQGTRVHDVERTRYLQMHVAALHDAIVAGVDVRGYFAWSLFDNFEWAFGYSKRFGIVYVDFATQQRIIKDSALWYRGFIAQQMGVNQAAAA